MHQLLNHTSGIDSPDKVKSVTEGIRDGLPLYQAPWTTDQLVARFCSGHQIQRCTDAAVSSGRVLKHTRAPGARSCTTLMSFSNSRKSG